MKYDRFNDSMVEKRLVDGAK